MQEFNTLVDLVCTSRVWVKGGNPMALMDRPTPPLNSTKAQASFMKQFVQRLQAVRLVKDQDVSQVKNETKRWSWGLKASVAATALVVGNIVYMLYNNTEGKPVIEVLGSVDKWKDGPSKALNAVCDFFTQKDGVWQNVTDKAYAIISTLMDGVGYGVKAIKYLASFVSPEKSTFPAIGPPENS